MSDGVALEVRGGVGGTSARLDDLEHAALLLRQVAARLAEVASAVLAAGADPGLVATGIVAPGSFAVAQASIGAAVAGPGGLLPLVARAELLGRALQGAATAYTAADRAAATGVRAVELAAGRMAGSAAARTVPLAAAGFAALAVVSVAWPTSRTAGAAGTPGGAAGSSGGAVREAAVPAALGRLGAVAVRVPAMPEGAVEHAVAAVPGVLAGLLEPVPGAGAVWRAAGRPWPPVTMGEAAGYVAAIGGVTPILRETGTASVSAASPRRVPAPRTLSDIVRRIPVNGETPSAGSVIHVDRVTGAGGQSAWVVGVPGTASWSPVPGGSPLDLTGNVHLMAGHPTAATAAVAAAMDSAGVGPGEPVLLAGHSQGGLVATALAADESFRRRYAVTHVVAVGSPIAGFGVPDGVSVLALEHSEDVVPQLDGAANPDRRNWVTVQRDALDGLTPPELARLGPDAAHRLDGYARTAAAAQVSADPSLVAWRDGLRPFLSPEDGWATAVDVTAERRVAP